MAHDAVQLPWPKALRCCVQRLVDQRTRVEPNDGCAELIDVHDAIGVDLLSDLTDFMWEIVECGGQDTIDVARCSSLLDQIRTDDATGGASASHDESGGKSGRVAAHDDLEHSGESKDAALSPLMLLQLLQGRQRGFSAL